MLSLEPDKYDFIYNRSHEHAVEIVREGLCTTADVPLDVLFWGRAFEAALQSGLDFLGIDSLRAGSPPSSLGNLFSYSLGPDNFSLVVNHYDLELNGTSSTLSDALMTNMRPSFVAWLLQVASPHTSEFRSSLSFPNYVHHLPDDILLVLVLLQSRSVQATSSLGSDASESSIQDANTALQGSFVNTPSVSDVSSVQASSHLEREEISLFTQVLLTVRRYALNLGDCRQHEDVDRAAILALQAVVDLDFFGTSTVITLADEALLVEILFKALNRRFEFAGRTDRDPSWLTPDLFERVWRATVAFIESGAVHEGWRSAGYVLNYVLHFASLLHAADAIYDYLVQQDWLRDIGLALARLANSTDPESDRLPDSWCPDIYSSRRASEVIEKAKLYLTESNGLYLSALSKILLIADRDTQNRLWKLGEIFRDTQCWSDCMQDLTDFVSCPGAGIEYAYVQCVITNVHGNNAAIYRPFEELSLLVETLVADLASGHFTPPLYPSQPDPNGSHPRLEEQFSPRKSGFVESCRKLFSPGMSAVLVPDIP
ncbi:hypothetical protein CPB85DRAFT_1299496 [Mucidula mucida]|nr:hypothetical protein CPB85DRAFT_1299496 [Mucidula mucida]